MMKTIEELEKEINEKQKQIEELKKAQITVSELTKEQKLAIYLHKKLCTHDHTDACGWYYADNNKGVHDWNEYAHKTYLKHATKIVNDLKVINVDLKQAYSIFDIMTQKI